MAVNKNKFKDEMGKLADGMAQLFSRSIKAGMLKGLEAAVRATKHDSSQAAAHWMIAGEDGRTSRPASRFLGKLQYLRGNKLRAPIAPAGYRGDSGKNTARTVTFVRQRELDEVLNKLVSGRHPEFRFYLYNAVGEVEKYNKNAGIDAAGEAGIQAAVAAAEAVIKVENTRKVSLNAR